MLLLWGRFAEFLLQHASFHSILFLLWKGQVLLLYETIKRPEKQVRKSNQDAKSRQKLIHAALNPTLELVSKQQGWGQTNLLNRGIHTFLTEEFFTSVTLHTSDMHTSSRMPQELLSVIPSTTYTWTPIHVFMFLLKLCQHTWLST